MPTNTLSAARATRPQPRIEALIASGAFKIEDRRRTFPPTGRRYVKRP